MASLVLEKLWRSRFYTFYGRLAICWLVMPESSVYRAVLILPS